MVARLLIVLLVAGGYSQAILKFPRNESFAIDRDKLTPRSMQILGKKISEKI